TGVQTCALPISAATPAATASRAAQQGPPQARPPSHTRLTRLWTLLVLALAAHNIEEGLGMADWISAHPWLPASPLHTDPAVFTRALVIVTAAIALLAAVAVVSRAAWSAETLACLSYALMANAAGHLAMSAASWALMHGAVTGAVLFLPLGRGTVRTIP